MQTAAVIGAGGGLGAALLRRFAAQGLHAAGYRRDAAALTGVVEAIRTSGGAASAEPLDVSKPDQILAALSRLEHEHGPLAVMVFNVAAFARKSMLEVSVEDFRAMLDKIAVAGFASVQAAARLMAPRAAGTILITGATASTKGSSGFAAFAAAKFALRAVAQSAAREFGPKGIHVAHVVVDGIISGPHTDAAWLEGLGEDGALSPDAIAEFYWSLHRQPRSAWTFEADLRPFSERW